MHSQSMRMPNKRGLAIERLEDRTLMTAGFIDPSFGNHGVAALNLAFSAATAVVVQPDFKIVAAGTVHSSLHGNPGEFLIARFNPDGSLDTSFGGTGYVISSFLGEAHAVALEGDKIVVVGKTAFPDPLLAGERPDILVARYNADGSPDTTFNGTGRVTTRVTALSDTAESVRLQNGRIVVAGTGMGVDVGTVEVLRYNFDGSLDTSFAKGGIFAAVGGSVADGNSGMELQPDGRILVAVTPPFFFPTAAWEVLRFNADGTLDTSFASGGTAKISAHGQGLAEGLAIQADGKILVDGFTGTSGAGLTRLNTDGTIDVTFHNGQLVDTPIAGSLAIQQGGEIVLLGTTPNSSSRQLLLMSITAGGQIDAGFGAGGQSLPAPPLTNQVFTPAGLVIEPDGKIVVAGVSSTANSLAVARYFNDTDNQKFLAHLYLDLLNRIPDPVGIQGWSELLDDGRATRTQVVLAMEHSPEYFAYVIDSTYSQTLGRSADPVGQAFWSNFLAAGGTSNALRTLLFLSPEFMQKHSDNTELVTALYGDALRRQPTAAETQVWLQALANGASRTAVIEAIVNGAEAARLSVDLLYQRFLRRNADPAGLAILSGLLLNGTPTEQLIAFIAGSDEYFARQ
ncbi:MAG TPA: DUF4214 domain-containing protein [Gemmataceae bacterium]|jgi:uncharacterized delta-60 repeat protein|nr:DUF4214 domain-containing protein [Gemmataceae bacterium]